MTIGIKRENGVADWLKDRLCLDALSKLASKKEVPVHSHSIWYYMGGIALMFIAIQVITGILLMVYYLPELETAHSSILKINSQVEFGWFVRSLHSWGANLLIAAVFVHMFSTYFMKAYRKPRELTWLTGMVLLVVMLGFGFTGYLLPWDDVSFFATKIGLDIAGKMPLVGPSICELLRGGSTIGQATLSRFFVIHVAVLPMVLLGLAGVHLAMVQAHGMSEPGSFKKLAQKTYEKFFPNFFLKDLLVWILAFNLLAVLVALAPWGIGPEADPFGAAPIGIKPEWYFLAPFQFLKLIPAQIGPLEGELFGILLIGLVVGALALVPFWDNDENSPRGKLATIYGFVVLLAMLVFTIWGALS